MASATLPWPAALGTDELSLLARATLHDRAVGVLVGSALGDAIGLYTEFMSTAQARSEYPDGQFTLLPDPTPFAHDEHRLKHRHGEWTDDTDHALLILLSILHRDGGLSPTDFASRLEVWVRMGLRALDSLPLGLGGTTASIVEDAEYLDDPVQTAYIAWAVGEYDIAPNGSLMRTHPLGVICAARSLEHTFEVAARFSRITHVDPRCVVACMVGTALIRGILRNEVVDEAGIDKVVQQAIAAYTGPGGLEETFRTEGPNQDGEPGLNVDEFLQHTTFTALSDLELDNEDAMGYVLKTLGSGILVLRLAMRRVASANGTLSAQLDVFEPLISELVMCAGDADTNACFAGALLGAYLGYHALPPQWRGGLLHGDWLLEKAEALCVVLGISNGTYVGKEDKDTYPDGGRGFLTEDDMANRWALLNLEMDEGTRQVVVEKKKALVRKMRVAIDASRIPPVVVQRQPPRRAEISVLDS